MKIISLKLYYTTELTQAARILMEAFADHWQTDWDALEPALEEVREMCAPDRICRAAVDDDGRVLGWIGGIEQGYDGRVWELHPLAVDPALHGRGIGRALVEDFEAQVIARGGSVVTLGTDDEDDMTTLAGVNLWDEPWRHIRDVRNLKEHPYEFYQKLGYVITGVLPDANGDGKPDIFMSKKLR